MRAAICVLPEFQPSTIGIHTLLMYTLLQVLDTKGFARERQNTKPCFQPRLSHVPVFVVLVRRSQAVQRPPETTFR